VAKRGERRWPLGLLSFALAVSLAVPSGAAGGSGTVRVAGNRVDLVLSLDGASPVVWRACHPSCAEADAGSGTSVRFTDERERPQPRLILGGPGPRIDLELLRFTAELAESARARTVTFQADLPVDGVRMVKSFEVDQDGYEVVMTARLSGPNALAFTAGRRLELELGAGRGLYPPPAAGFAAMLERVSPVIVTDDGVRGRNGGTPSRLRAGDWVGFRDRFWAILTRPDGASTLAPRPGPGDLLVVSDGPGQLSWRYTFYSGPLEQRALIRADPVLERMLFSGLWSWLRTASFALLSLLRGLTAIAGSTGLAIVALAASVKILLLPLSAAAARLQEQVNTTQARLEPRIAAIRAAHRGEERARRTLGLYREEGVNPLYTMKSLLGVAIQLPVFIAVFDMLADDFDLNGMPFLWIRDLSRPDELLRLATCVPFFGCHLNLLPFLMSGVSIVVLLRFRSPTLTPSLARRQRRNLTGVTVLFFLLFYTFPAGMVLYWTSTNAFQLASQELGRLWQGWRPTRPGPPAA
jgi:YidC/Oxa1 family membrane protein insertase